MPIPIERLEDAQRSLDERILGFLSDHQTEAFSLLEIIRAVEGLDATIAALMLVITSEQSRELQMRYTQALGKLVEAGIVRSAPYRGTPYYAFARGYR